jgi:hypothetical protein
VVVLFGGIAPAVLWFLLGRIVLAVWWFLFGGMFPAL